MSNRNKLSSLLTIPVLTALLFLTGCQGMYYATMEALGRHKRDILTNRIQDCTGSFQKTNKQFQELQVRLDKVKDFKDENVETTYRRLSSQYRKCLSKASNLGGQITEIRKVGRALFWEWENELEQYSNEQLRRSSEQRLEKRRKRYLQVVHVMKSANEKIKPVLFSASDYILFLKHNLNAQAARSLNEELESVKLEVSLLIDKMQLAADEGRKFVVEMDIEDEAKK